MRLTTQQIDVIKKQTMASFGHEATVWLFGSRVDDAARGGDIDLLVQLSGSIPQKQSLAQRLNAQLQMALGLQKIDIVIMDATTLPLPIHQHALATGVRL